MTGAYMRAVWVLAATFGFLSGGHGGAIAGGEVCVRCDNPFAIYRCQLDHPAAGPETPVGFVCITELAKQNGHRTCAVSRDAGTACAGDPVVVRLPPGAPLPVAPPLVADRPALAPQPTAPVPPGNDPAVEKPETAEGELAKPAEPQEDGTPKTVEELAKKTAIASQKSLEKAGDTVSDAAKQTGKALEKTGDVIGDAAQKTGDAIGSAAKKTWRCLSSLFGNC